MFPALWGLNSFNWGGGMDRLRNGAALVKANMPHAATNRCGAVALQACRLWHRNDRYQCRWLRRITHMIGHIDLDGGPALDKQFRSHMIAGNRAFRHQNTMSPKPTDYRRSHRGILLISIAVMLFAIMDAISKYLTRFYPVTSILWARYLFHTLAIVAVLSPRFGWRLVRTARPGIQIIRGVLLPVSSMAFVLAIKYMPIAEASSITFVSPMIVALLAVAFLKEKVARNQWLAIVSGFLGVLIIMRPGTGVFAWASLLPLGVAFMMAIYHVLTRRIAGLESVHTSIFYPGFIGLLIFSLTLPYTWTPPQNIAHLVLLGLGGILGALSHLILIKAYDYASASRLAPFTYSQMVWATALGYLVFGNFPDFWSLVGITILGAGGIYLATHQRRP